MRKSQVYFPLVLLIICALALVNSLKLPFRTGLMVWLVLVAMIPMLVAQILIEISDKRKKSITDPSDARRYLVAGAWILIALPMVYLMGFMVTVLIYNFLYLKVNGEKLWFSITISVLLTATVYIAFELALGLSLYKGIFFSEI